MVKTCWICAACVGLLIGMATAAGMMVFLQRSPTDFAIVGSIFSGILLGAGSFFLALRWCPK